MSEDSDVFSLFSGTFEMPPDTNNNTPMPEKPNKIPRKVKDESETKEEREATRSRPQTQQRSRSPSPAGRRQKRSDLSDKLKRYEGRHGNLHQAKELKHRGDKCISNKKKEEGVLAYFESLIIYCDLVLRSEMKLVDIFNLWYYVMQMANDTQNSVCRRVTELLFVSDT